MTQPRRTQTERHDATHAALVEAAVEVIARRGYAEATLQEIADAAGVSKGAVHYHFRAKHEIVAPVLERCAAHLRARTAAAWRGTGPPAERLRAALRAMWDTWRSGGPEVSALAEFLVRGLRDPRVREALTPVISAAERDLGAEIDAGLAALGLRPRIAPAVIPRTLLGLLDGLALQQAYAEGRGEAEVAAAIETLAFAMLAV